jgi:hypothetical protein
VLALAILNTPFFETPSSILVSELQRLNLYNKKALCCLTNATSSRVDANIPAIAKMLTGWAGAGNSERLRK